MPKTKKQLIVQSFEKMDINMLHVLLDDDKTYQDATKEVFLSKLEGVFNHLKEAGNTVLQTHKGFCDSNICHKGCAGYLFNGNISNDHIALIFQEAENDITDIFYCSDFKLFDSDKNDIDGRDLDIDIRPDEKADFVPDTDFVMISHNCSQAIDKLMQYSEPIDSHIYSQWLSQHIDLVETIEEQSKDYAVYRHFYFFYYHFKELETILLSDTDATNAIEAFAAIDTSDEMSTIYWLIKFEYLNDNLIFLDDVITMDDNLNIQPIVIFGVQIDQNEFKNVTLFNSIYTKHYSIFFDKFSTFWEEKYKGLEVDPMSTNASLSFILSVWDKLK